MLVETTDTTRKAARNHRWVAVASLIGTAIEWYDFLLYGTASALVFPQLFFPTLSSAAGTLASFATFGVAFVARPIGGVFFGHFGDRIGRKSALVTTLLIMGGSTSLLGLLPDFAHIGVLAPILLVALRFLQGFAVGGEWGGATLMAMEHAPDESRCFYSSWPAMGAPIGLMLSTAVFARFASMPKEQFLAWGWRIPFLLSVVLVVVGLMIRLRLAESPVFSRVKQLRSVSRLPILEVLKNYALASCVATGVVLIGSTGFYIVITFSLAYLTGQLGVPKHVLLVGMFLAGMAQMTGMLVFSWLADRVGKRPIAIWSSVSIALLGYPYFILIDTAQPLLIWIAMSAWMFAGGALAGITGPLIADLYPARLRYSGISFSYQTAGMLGGAPAPFIASALHQAAGGASWPVGAYLTAISLVSFAAIYWSSKVSFRSFGD